MSDLAADRRIVQSYEADFRAPNGEVYTAPLRTPYDGRAESQSLANEEALAAFGDSLLTVYRVTTQRAGIGYYG